MIAERAGRIAGGKPVLLAVARMVPWPPAHGFTVRVDALLAAMAQQWDIVLLTSEQSARDGYVAPPGVRLVTAPWDPASPAFRDQLRTAATDVVREFRPDAALLWTGTESLAIDDPQFPPAVADWLDCLTLGSLRRHLTQTTLRGHVRTLLITWQNIRRERRVVHGLPVTVVVGEEDARALRRVTGRDSVRVVPNGVAMRPWDDFADADPHPTVIFTGVMSFAPNADAATWFAKRVWPRVREQIPDARYLIAGRQPTPEVMALAAVPGISVLPDVPDMFATLRRAWLAVSPMRAGTGIKNKVLEAWSVGRAAVMTSQSANGLRLDATASALVCDAPAAMAASITRLLRNREATMQAGLSAHTLAAREHGWSVMAMEMTRLLDLAREQRAHGTAAPQAASLPRPLARHA